MLTSKYPRSDANMQNKQSTLNRKLVQRIDYNIYGIPTQIE